MKYLTKEDFEYSEPEEPLSVIIEFCLKKLYADETREACEEVVRGLTFEELIGALVKTQNTYTLKTYV